MAKLRIRGHDLIIKQITKCRNVDIIELQRQSKLKMAEIRAQVEEADHLGNVIASFLAQHNAGFRPTWDELLNGTLEDLGEFIAEPGDELAESEDEAEGNPPSSGAISAEGGEAETSTPA